MLDKPITGWVSIVTAVCSLLVLLPLSKKSLCVLFRKVLGGEQGTTTFKMETLRHVAKIRGRG